MIIVGLTGSIGMGKSTTASAIRDLGIPVLDADQVVHDLYQDPLFAKDIEDAFPGTVVDGRVDRQKLGSHLAQAPDGFRTLESIVHPQVRQAQMAFLRDQNRLGSEIAVLEIPLLFETGGQTRVDVVIVVSAKPETQRARVLARPEMTEEKFAQLLARQMPDEEKRNKADFVVDTEKTPDACAVQIADIIASLKGKRGDAFTRFWTPSSLE